MRNCYVVIATWGHPAQWRDATYYTPDRDVIRTCCNLIPLLKYLIKLHELESLKKVYILGLDSIADLSRSKTICQKSHYSNCREIFCNCLNTHRDKIDKLMSIFEKEFNSYRYLLEIAEILYRCVFENLIDNNSELKILFEKNIHKVFILPAIGRPGGRLVFRGSPEDYISIALIEIGTDLLETDLSNCEKITIVFDSTHGINYMPVLTTKIAIIVAEMLRMRYNADITLEIYNSDPCDPDPHQEQNLNINKIYSKEIREIEIPRITTTNWSSIYRESDSIDEKQYINISNEYEKFVSWFFNNIVKDVISSLYSPSPLALAYACHNYLCKYIDSISEQTRVSLHCDKICKNEHKQNNALNILRELKNMWINHIVINREENNNYVRIVRKLSLNTNTIWSTLLSHAICLNVYEKLEEGSENIEEFNNMIAFNYKFLKQLTGEEAKTLYWRIHSSLFYIISDELSKIEQYEEEILKHAECVEYGEIIRQREEKAKDSKNLRKDRNKQPSERLLIAHAGLQYDLVDICVKNHKAIFIKYRDCSTLNKVFSRLRSILVKKPSKM